MTILSNLSLSDTSHDTRREILNSKVLDVLARLLTAPKDLLDLSTIDCTIWFMHHLTKNFESRHISESSEEPLLSSLIQMLYLPAATDWLCQRIVRLTISCLINLTKCEAVVFGREDPRSEFAAKRIVQYEKAQQEPSFWVWVQGYTVRLLDGAP